LGENENGYIHYRKQSVGSSKILKIELSYDLKTLFWINIYLKKIISVALKETSVLPCSLHHSHNIEIAKASISRLTQLPSQWPPETGRSSST
jgi:hypothetical protein